MIADEQHWCRGHIAQDVSGVAVSPTLNSAVKRCGLGALISAAYQLTHDFDVAYELGHKALRPRYGPATLTQVDRREGSRSGAYAVRRSDRSGIGEFLAVPPRGFG